jgi:hypothetical protein
MRKRFAREGQQHSSPVPDMEVAALRRFVHFAMGHGLHGPLLRLHTGITVAVLWLLLFTDFHQTVMSLQRHVICPKASGICTTAFSGDVCRRVIPVLFGPICALDSDVICSGSGSSQSGGSCSGSSCSSRGASAESICGSAGGAACGAAHSPAAGASFASLAARWGSLTDCNAVLGGPTEYKCLWTYAKCVTRKLHESSKQPARSTPRIERSWSDLCFAAVAREFEAIATIANAQAGQACRAAETARARVRAPV